MAVLLAVGFAYTAASLATAEVALPSEASDPWDFLSSFEMAADDECAEGSCALSALQLRGQARVNATTDNEEEVSTQYVRRRRSTLPVYPATKVDPPHRQYTTCWGQPLKAGYEGCCGRYKYAFKTAGCCGQYPYRTDQLACCDHGNGYAQLYHPLSQNCCDDDFQTNKNSGICDLDAGETSCCEIKEHRRRRAHRRRRRTGLVQASESDKEDLDEDEEPEDVQDVEEES